MMIRPRETTVQLVRTVYDKELKRGKQVNLGSFESYISSMKALPDEVTEKLTDEEKAQLDEYFSEKRKKDQELSELSRLREFSDAVTLVSGVLARGDREKIARLGDLAVLDQKLSDLRKQIKKMVPRAGIKLSSTAHGGPVPGDGEAVEGGRRPEWFIDHGGQNRLSDAGIAALRELYDAGVSLSDAAARIGLSLEGARKRFKMWASEKGETPAAE